MLAYANASQYEFSMNGDLSPSFSMESRARSSLGIAGVPMSASDLAAFEYLLNIPQLNMMRSSKGGCVRKAISFVVRSAPD